MRKLRTGIGLRMILLLASIGVTSALYGQAGKPKKLQPLEILQRAHQYFAEGDCAQARKYYLEVLHSFPNSFDILKDLGDCYFALGRGGYAAAAVYYARAYAVNPQSAAVGSRLTECYMALGRYSEAVATALKLAELPGTPPEAWRRVAEAYEAAHEGPQAASAYNAYLQRNPGDLRARVRLARIYGQQKFYHRALEQYRIILSTNPDYPPALVGMAQILAWEGQLDPSLALFNRVLQAEPHNGEAESGKAFVLLWQGHNQQALAIFKDLQQRFPGDREVARGLANAQNAVEQEAFLEAKKAGNVSAIVAYYHHRLNQNPRDVEALKALMAFTANARQCQQSIAFGRQALKLSAGDPDVELGLARSLALCQDYTRAVARYRDYLASHPQAEGALYELGDTLTRASRLPEAITTFRQLLKVDPKNLGGEIGLAQALAATGQHAEALKESNLALQQAPDNYEALQGKGYLLYYQNDFAQARSIFQSLEEKNPGDPENAKALRDISKAEEQARWAALRPAPDAPPQDWLKFFRKRLASYPNDRDALKGLAYVESELDNAPAAIAGYRHVLDLYPKDRDARLELARLLALDRQYLASIRLYQEVLKRTPGDPAVLQSLARVDAWAGNDSAALKIYQQLLASRPDNTGYELEVGRLEARLKQYPAAANTLASLLNQEPSNRDARLEVARLDLNQGQLEKALQNYEILLKYNPQDPDALLGRAQINYGQGKLSRAHTSAAQALLARPKDFSSLFLMASIEHARGRRQRALQLLRQADAVSPGNPEVASLRQQIRSESAVTVSTTVAYAREIGPPSSSGSVRGLANEDLRMFTYGTTVQATLMPKTTSFFTFNSLLSDSPPSPFRDALGNQLPTGITGAAGPSEYLYRQATQLTSHFDLRAGIGAVRFGPGDLVSLGGQKEPVPSARERVLWQAGVSYTPTARLDLAFDAVRSPFAYTPVAARFGLIEDELRAQVNYFFSPRTRLYLAYAYGLFSTQSYEHFDPVSGRPLGSYADTDRGHFGWFSFNHTFYQSERLSFQGGYSGRIYGFTRRQHPFLGFYNPDLYQLHELDSRIHGNLWGPVGYDLMGGLGIQQAGKGQAITRAWDVTPAFSLQVSRNLLLRLGYTHYNTAQALGPLRGNAVRLDSQWKF